MDLLRMKVPSRSDRNSLSSSKEGDGCSTHHTVAIPRVKKGLRLHTRNVPSLLAHIYPGMVTIQWLEASEVSSGAELVTAAQHTAGSAGTAFSTDVAECVSIQKSQKFLAQIFFRPSTKAAFPFNSNHEIQLTAPKFVFY